ncbi:Ubiquitin carboxyl-terminal hydrolase 12, partial [Mucuna pruriens]
MEIKTADPLFSVKTMKGRKAPPSQYTLTIKSFSWLSKASVQKCTSEESLSIYPTGNTKEGGQGHVSIYLVLMDSTSLPLDWEVNAIVNFSAYNFIDDEYITTQDTNVRRFHVLKTVWGVAKLIDIDTFNDPSNGYLMDDTCVFGAEVFVVKTKNKGDCLTMIHGPINCSHSWKFNNFSYEKLDKYESESKLILYPNGIVEGKGNSISLFLVLEVSTLPPNTKLVVECTLRAKDQVICRKFSSSNSTWGSRQLVALAKLKDPNSGFLVNDSCILEAEFTILGLMTPN